MRALIIGTLFSLMFALFIGALLNSPFTLTPFDGALIIVYRHSRHPLNELSAICEGRAYEAVRKILIAINNYNYGHNVEEIGTIGENSNRSLCHVGIRRRVKLPLGLHSDHRTAPPVELLYFYHSHCFRPKQRPGPKEQ